MRGLLSSGKRFLVRSGVKIFPTISIIIDSWTKERFNCNNYSSLIRATNAKEEYSRRIYDYPIFRVTIHRKDHYLWSQLYINFFIRCKNNSSFYIYIYIYSSSTLYIHSFNQIYVFCKTWKSIEFVEFIVLIELIAIYHRLSNTKNLSKYLHFISKFIHRSIRRIFDPFLKLTMALIRYAIIIEYRKLLVEASSIPKNWTLTV